MTFFASVSAVSPVSVPAPRPVTPASLAQARRYVASLRADGGTEMRGAITRHEALPLVFANGDYKGWFVPTEVRVTTRQVMRDGTLIWMEAELTLREYVRPVVLIEETTKQDAVATEKTDPNGQVKKPAQTVNRTPASRPASVPPTRSAR